MRVRTTDRAGNSSDWTDGFSYAYDNTAPTNPTIVTEMGGAQDDSWQSTVSYPAFSWSGATDGGNGSGVQDYDVYWGTSASGTTVITTTTDAAYVPTALPANGEGAYYLRLRTRSGTGATANWETVFTFKYDNKSPVGPTAATETAGAQSDTWLTGNDSPAFTWAAASDRGSGVQDYDVYWGASSGGTTVVTTTTNAAYTPASLTTASSGVYYLRVRSRDAMNHTGNWATTFIFRYDGEAPTAPTTATEAGGVVNDTWQSTVSSPSFSWTGAADGAGSGIKEYDVYWGTDSGGITVTNRTSTPSYAPGQTTGTYYLRVRSRDNVGQESAWTSLFTFHYADAPTNPTTVTETGGAVDGDWQRTVNAPAFTWSGATDGGNGSGIQNYEVYFGSSASGTTVITTTVGAAYTASPVSDGTYYLRLRTRNNTDMVSDWETAFTFRYDSTPPGAIGSVTESSSVTDGDWQGTVSDQSFSWGAASDNASGVAGYEVYWGTDANGTTAITTTTPAYDPSAVGSGTYYLRDRPYDRAGNYKAWQTLFTFRYDSSAPDLTLDAPTVYPATLDFTVRRQVKDDESGPDTCTVERQTGGLHSYLVNNEAYATQSGAQHFENISGVTVVFTATCSNEAALTTVITASTLIAPAVADADSDEMPDIWETGYGLNPNDASDAAGDLDSDELTNLQEYQYGTDPTVVDTDGDSLSDYDEVMTMWGSAAARVAEANSTNPVDWDTDGDGFSDGSEVSGGSDPLDGDSPYDLTVDTDGDGMPDGWETSYGLNPNDASDAAGDLEADGLDNLTEFRHRASPLDTDTDSDGLSDDDEVNIHHTDPTIADTDNDGWGDGEEFSQGTDPIDGNNSPTLDDGDEDGMPDGWEDDNGLDSSTNDAESDPDGDGLTNREEYAYETDPNSADSDGDGFDDKAEIDAGSDPNNRSSTPDNPGGEHKVYLPLIAK